MSLFKLTALTKPIKDTGDGASRFKNLAGRFRKQRDYGGHAAVTRSLVEGCQKEGIDLNYNPSTWRDVGDVCHVLADVDALRQAIQWKRQHRIKLLLAGPNLVVRSDEHDGILASPEIDVCLVPSEWVKVAYEEDAPSLSGRIHVWYAGVDEEYWNPDLYRAPKGKSVLVYWKSGNSDFCEVVERILEKKGWKPERVTYGLYKKPRFRRLLAKSAFAVFLSQSESQGIALAEAWAMDVPTLAWEPEHLFIQGRPYTVFSAAPYLNDLVGAKWRTLDELDHLLARIPECQQSWTPRQWVVSHMTDKLSAMRLIDIIRQALHEQAHPFARSLP